MRIAPLALALTMTLGSTAYAAEHLMQINEVMLSDNGDGTAQFVELHDTGVGGEPFGNTPYRLDVYDANGGLVGSVPVSIVTGPPNTTDWYVATASSNTIFGITSNDNLSVALPTDGQVCFVDKFNNKIHCLAWGCVNTLVAVGEATGASPPDGESLSRNLSGTYSLTTPTPKQPNVDGTTGPACPTAPDAAPGAPDAAPGGPDANPASPDATAGSPDASSNPNNGSSSGCCRVDGRDGAGGAAALALLTLVAIRRRATAR